jgi:23S rRNA pseudouridine1911/1915/1917 synthase
MSASDSEATGTLIVLEADADAAGVRLDQWLAAALRPICRAAASRR